MPNSRYQSLSRAITAFISTWILRRGKRFVAVHQLGLEAWHWQKLSQHGVRVPVAVVQLAWANLVHCFVHNGVVQTACDVFGKDLVEAAGWSVVTNGCTEQGFIGGVAVECLLQLPACMHKPVVGLF